jgi:hypothetical protein
MTRIGIDYHQVLSSGKHRGIDVAHAVKALKLLKQQGHKLYLVSKCTKTRAKSRKELIGRFRHLFTQLVFVPTKEAKQFVCRKLGLGVFIDDDTDVIRSLQAPYTVLFQNKQTVHPCNLQYSNFVCNDWLEIVEHLRTAQVKHQTPDPLVDISTLVHRV